ncbi:family 20 glycosylhydrolase [Nocardia tengchongensis]|uniref:family 20 glycosylhydrolase n=1 Tax=Nocardia tengchongensis TaxID=2055889 RepID=UPI00367A7B06
MSESEPFAGRTAAVTGASSGTSNRLIGIVPTPYTVRHLPGLELELTSGTAVLAASDAARPVAERFVSEYFSDTSVRLNLIHDAAEAGGSVLEFRLDPLPDHAVPEATGIDPTGTDTDERYSIRIEAAGAMLTAHTAAGLYRASASLRQLAAAHRISGTGITPMTVLDGPRYRWRGLSLDMARHFFTVGELCRVIDLLAYYKLNVLHLHLTDNEGWRLQILGHPALTEQTDDFLSVGEYAAITDYARQRFITIVPEIDMPGHIGAAAAAYPEIGTGTEAEAKLPGLPATAFAYLDPDNEHARRFVSDVVAAVVELTPGPFVHIGGDETMFMPADKYRRFIDFAATQLAKRGKRVIAWQEAVRAEPDRIAMFQYWNDMPPPPELAQALDMIPPNHPLRAMAATLLDSAILDAFRSESTRAQADPALLAQQSTPVLLSPATHVYLDRPYAEPPHDTSAYHPPLGHPLYQAWTIRRSWEWDPAQILDDPGIGIAGVEAAVWCETVDSFADLGRLMLPRLAGTADRAWSLSTDHTWDEYRDRLAPHARWWRQRGWDYFDSSLVDWA